MKLKIVLFVIVSGSCFTKCNSQQKKVSSKPVIDTAYIFRNGSVDGIGKFYMGREIAHVMGASGSEWLERDERNKEENTQLAIEKINLPADGVVADIGAGTGYYSFRLAAKVSKGKVYAVEVQDEMISYLKNKKGLLKDSIVEIVKSTPLSPNLPDTSVDLAIMVDVYHELEFPHEMLHAIRKALKHNGKILLLEYRGEDPSVPIKLLHKTTVAQLNRELMANGFQLNYKGDFLPIQHFLLYEKVKEK
jgi:SAM-dependent methyltransferase